MNSHDMDRLPGLLAHQKELRGQKRILKLKITEAKKRPGSGLSKLKFDLILIDDKLNEVKRQIKRIKDAKSE